MILASTTTNVPPNGFNHCRALLLAYQIY